MGLIRTFLALIVVIGHTGFYVGTGGRFAVQLFYMISGYLMSYILFQNPTYRSVSKFYLNRFLRLFPVYWVIASITFFMYLLGYFYPKYHRYFNIYPDFFEVYSQIGFFGAFSLAFSNIFLFGQDWIMFTGVKTGIYQFVVNFRDSDVKVWHGLLVPQAWTLGVELTFYLIAPFVLKNIKRVIFLLIFSLSIRVFLIFSEFGITDPWTYRFFPAELSVFLLGALAQQYLYPFYKKILLAEFCSVSKYVVAFIFFYCALFFMMPGILGSGLILVTIFMFALPFLFEFQKSLEADRVIGDLSYPIYISHMIIIPPVTAFVRDFFPSAFNAKISAVAVVFLVVIFSYILDRAISRNVEYIRSKIRAV